MLSNQARRIQHFCTSMIPRKLLFLFMAVLLVGGSVPSLLVAPPAEAAVDLNQVLSQPTYFESPSYYAYTNDVDGPNQIASAKVQLWGQVDQIRGHIIVKAMSQSTLPYTTANLRLSLPTNSPYAIKGSKSSRATISNKSKAIDVFSCSNVAILGFNVGPNNEVTADFTISGAAELPWETAFTVEFEHNLSSPTYSPLASHVRTLYLNEQSFQFEPALAFDANGKVTDVYCMDGNGTGTASGSVCHFQYTYEDSGSRSAMKYQGLGSSPNLFGGGAAVSYNTAGQVNEIYAIDKQNGNLYWNRVKSDGTKGNDSWSSWPEKPSVSKLLGRPAIAFDSMGDVKEMYAIDDQGWLWCRYYIPGQAEAVWWQSWPGRPDATQLYPGPAVSFDTSGDVKEMYAVGKDGNLWCRYYQNGQLVPWQSWMGRPGGTTLKGSPSLAFTSSGSVQYVYATGSNGGLYYRSTVAGDIWREVNHSSNKGGWAPLTWGPALAFNTAGVVQEADYISERLGGLWFRNLTGDQSQNLWNTYDEAIERQTYSGPTWQPNPQGPVPDVDKAGSIRYSGNSMDVDGGGCADVASVNPDKYMWYYKGWSNGQVLTQPVGLGTGPWGLRSGDMWDLPCGVGDVNGDGYADVVSVNGNKEIWYYQGPSLTTPVLCGVGPWGLRSNDTWDMPCGVGDVDGGGYADLVCVNKDGYVWYYKGPDLLRPVGCGYVSGGLQANSTQVKPCGVSDVDGDGFADIVCVNADGYISYYKGPGLTQIVGCGYAPGGLRANGTQVTPCGAGDVDGDGYADVICVNADKFLWYLKGPGLTQAVGCGTGPWGLQAAATYDRPCGAGFGWWWWTTGPGADFSADRTQGVGSLLVNFADLSTPADRIRSWSWNFGDSQSSTERNPSHQYNVGTYSVTLAVTDADGRQSTATKYNYITVTNTGGGGGGTVTGGRLVLDMPLNEGSGSTVHYNLDGTASTVTASGTAAWDTGGLKFGKNGARIRIPANAVLKLLNGFKIEADICPTQIGSSTQDHYYVVASYYRHPWGVRLNWGKVETGLYWSSSNTWKSDSTARFQADTSAPYTFKKLVVEYSAATGLLKYSIDGTVVWQETVTAAALRDESYAIGIGYTGAEDEQCNFEGYIKNLKIYALDAGSSGISGGSSGGGSGGSGTVTGGRLVLDMPLNEGSGSTVHYNLDGTASTVTASGTAAWDTGGLKFGKNGARIRIPANAVLKLLNGFKIEADICPTQIGSSTQDHYYVVASYYRHPWGVRLNWGKVETGLYWSSSNTWKSDSTARFQADTSAPYTFKKLVVEYSAATGLLKYSIDGTVVWQETVTAAMLRDESYAIGIGYTGAEDEQCNFEGYIKNLKIYALDAGSSGISGGSSGGGSGGGSTPSTSQVKALYVWAHGSAKYHVAIVSNATERARFFKVCQNAGVNTVWVQVDGDSVPLINNGQFASFIQEAKSKGIAIHGLLSGSGTYAKNQFEGTDAAHESIVKKMLEHNYLHPDAKFAGIHFDMENVSYGAYPTNEQFFQQYRSYIANRVKVWSYNGQTVSSQGMTLSLYQDILPTSSTSHDSDYVLQSDWLNLIRQFDLIGLQSYHDTYSGILGKDHGRAALLQQENKPFVLLLETDDGLADGITFSEEGRSYYESVMSDVRSYYSSTYSQFAGFGGHAYAVSYRDWYNY